MKLIRDLKCGIITTLISQYSSLIIAAILFALVIINGILMRHNVLPAYFGYINFIIPIGMGHCIFNIDLDNICKNIQK